MKSSEPQAEPGAGAEPSSGGSGCVEDGVCIAIQNGLQSCGEGGYAEYGGYCPCSCAQDLGPTAEPGGSGTAEPGGAGDGTSTAAPGGGR